MGSPEVLPGTTGAFPILRTDRAASHPVGTETTDGLFLVNADVYPRDRGSPVFTAGRGGRPKVVGMIIRRSGAERHAFSHLAVAVNAGVIRETSHLVVQRDEPSAARQVDKIGLVLGKGCVAARRMGVKLPLP